MWTPRRIAFALVGLILAVSAFLVYSRFLGQYDGLPPLPAEYYPGVDAGPPPPARLPSSDRRFELAFGANCPELRFPIKLEMKQRGILIASHRFKIIESGPRQGWIEAAPLSMAAFSDRRGPDGLPEINTVYCDLAYLRLDKPVRSSTDFSGRKIVACELHADPEARLADPRKGRIRLINNRRTADPNDDIELVTPGPVYYDAEPTPGLPHIYTHSEVQIFDHLNTDLPEPDHTAVKPPTMTGTALTVFLLSEPKAKARPGTKADPNPKRKDSSGGIAGVESIGFARNVEVNIWTDANASFVAPTSSAKKKESGSPPGPGAKAGPDGQAKVPDKRLLQIRTNGPFRYDLTRETAHFERPAQSPPGLVEHVTITRTSPTAGQDLLDCEFLDLQLQRRRAVAKDGGPKPPPGTPASSASATSSSPVTSSSPERPARKDAGRDGDLEIRSIRAWGETVVITSDAARLQATGVELIHDVDARMTILRGEPNNPIQVVKDGHLIRGLELHMFGDGREITQAHILGRGSISVGEPDPKTGAYLRTASWSERMVYQRVYDRNQPPVDVVTLIGKEGVPARFRDQASGKLQQIEGMHLKVWLAADKPKDSSGHSRPPTARTDPAVRPAADGRADRPPAKQPNPTSEKTKKDPAGSVKPLRIEGRGDVRSITPDLIIQHTDYLNVVFTDVPRLLRPPRSQGGAATPEVGPPPREIAPTPVRPPVGPTVKPAPAPPPRPPADNPPSPPTADSPPPKAPPKEKIPFVVTARSIEAWVNRDPDGQSEIDHVHAVGDVEANQDPPKDQNNKLGNAVSGQTVDIQAYPDGHKLTVIGDPTDPSRPKWGTIRLDTLTVFGFDMVVDQRTDTALVKGEGRMEILSQSDLSGQRREQASNIYIFWKERMDFLGAEKLIYFHGGVQAYQDLSRLKCEWMQVLLDRPVYIDPDRRAQARPPSRPSSPTKDMKGFRDDDVQIDTVMCFHAPKDDDRARAQAFEPVLAVEEIKQDNRTIRFQLIRALELVTVNTPSDPKTSRKDLHATASPSLPGEVRLFQPGRKDMDNPRATPALTDPKESRRPPAAKSPPRKKGELGPDEEMKLTIVQFSGKMRAEEQRKRAKFWNNIRVLHLPADRPDLAIDLRDGDIPRGAIYLECRDTFEVFTTTQKERDASGELIDVEYQEMIAVGNVRVRKQGEFFGDADRVTYDERKGTFTFHGSDRNPAVLNQIRGQGLPNKTLAGRTIIYHIRTRTGETIGGVQIRD